MKKKFAIMLFGCMMAFMFVNNKNVTAQELTEKAQEIIESPTEDVQEAVLEGETSTAENTPPTEMIGENTEDIVTNENAGIADESDNVEVEFSVNANQAYCGIFGGDSPVVNTGVKVDGRDAVEIIHNYTDSKFERIYMDVSAGDFPKDVLMDSNYVSVKYKYVAPEGKIVKKDKIVIVLVVGRDKTVVSHAVKSEEKTVSGGWTTAVFNLEKFKEYKSGEVEQMYIYPFGYYNVKQMAGLSEKMYIGDIGFHEHRPDVEVVKEETTNKVVAVQKPKSGFGKVTHDLFLGLGTTLMLFVLTLLFALPLGLVISLGAICKIKIIKMPIKVFVWVIRGTPLMLQLMLFFFGPGLLGFKALNNFTAALIAFVINYACYFSEIFRGGIESIPKGQYEAGKVLGLTKVQVFFKIVLMQVVKNILPPMSNEFLTLVKDTALANTITVIEITWIAKRFISEGLLWPLFYSGVFYLAVCGILTILFNRIEKKLDYYKV